MKFGMRELAFVGLLVAICATSAIGLKKMWERRDFCLAETQRKQKILGELKESTRGIKDLETKIKELKDAITFFEGKLPQEKEIDKILKEISQMAEANALQTKTVKTLKSERAANYSEQPIEWSMSGNFNGFYAFMLQLEKLPRITRVTNMALTKITDQDGAMQAKVTLRIFFEPETGSSKFAATN
ncbi:MAG TPA: type 4a pilus biogenesis protein PilO [Tepidisphaeraceae bacterium]|jgi:type IV pilus assembly protein PilO|nr:type 4a pilus biogenesis protein PilO [Tepidisphaeraceae bacterium]